MPDVGDMGTPENVEYDYFYAQGSIFSWSSEVLICEYSPQDYQEQVSRLEEQFVFQQEQVSAHEYSLEPEVSVQGYNFRLLSFEDKTYRLDYPKYMVFVGTNDETCEIVWMYCEDPDLDYIVSLEEHILIECGWKYIR